MAAAKKTAAPVKHQLDHRNAYLNAPRPIYDALKDFWSFTVPGAVFMPQVKSGAWDGRIRLLRGDGRLSAGLFRATYQEAAEKLGLTFDIREELPEVEMRAAPQVADEKYLYQRDCVDKMAEAIPRGGGIVLCATSTGKCLGKGTRVLKFDGTTVPVESLQAGDQLMGPDSKPRTILSTTTGRGEMYKIRPVRGVPYTVNASHILSLQTTRRQKNNLDLRAGEHVTISVRDYLALPKYSKHILKGWHTGVDFQPRKTTVPPYFLGLWLGDGESCCRCPTISKPGEEVRQAVKETALFYGLQVTSNYNGRCPSHSITAGWRGAGENPLTRDLRKLGVVNNKHVPQVYRANSRDVRLQVLAGLLDSDGHLSKGAFEFSNKCKRLAIDAAFLARSLGLMATIRPMRKCAQTGVWGDYFRVCITGAIEMIPTRIPRKKAQPSKRRTDTLRSGIKVIPKGVGQYFGFELDGNGLFLLGDFTVTHATRIAGCSRPSGRLFGCCYSLQGGKKMPTGRG